MFVVEALECPIIEPCMFVVEALECPIIEPRARVQCGGGRTTQSSCETQGCCWDGAAGGSTIACYGTGQFSY